MTKLFTLRRKTPNTEITVNNTPIPWLDKQTPLKYLGMELDTRLTYKHHVTRKLGQAYGRLTKLYPLINKKSPLRTDCTLLLYKSLLRPILTYACPVWFSVSSTTRHKLESFQNKVLRLAVNAPWFVRNSQLSREMGVDTLEDHLKGLTTKHFDMLPLFPATADFYLGSRTEERRLKPRLFQDMDL